MLVRTPRSRPDQWGRLRGTPSVPDQTGRSRRPLADRVPSDRLVMGPVEIRSPRRRVRGGADGRARPDDFVAVKIEPLLHGSLHCVDVVPSGFGRDLRLELLAALPCRVVIAASCQHEDEDADGTREPSAYGDPNVG